MAGYSVTFSVVDQATAQIEAINKRIQQMRAPMERQAKAFQQFVDVSGLGKVADGFKNIARTALDAFNSMVRIVPVLGTITSAATIAGVAALVNTWGQFGLTLQRDADRIGTSAQTLERLQDVARLAGGSVDNMTESLKELTDQSAAAVTGNAQAFAAFKQFGISLYDANGQLRTATDLLPQVLQALDNIKNPADRMKVALQLGGKALFDLTEDMDRAKRPGESLADTWQRLNNEAAKYGEITNDQIAAQQRYKEAMGGLETAFEHLQIGIGTTLANALTPFFNQLSEFVQTHTPQIQQAISQLVTGFAEWIKGLDWEKIKAGAQSVIDALNFLADHLDTIVKVALVIKGLQIATGLVSSISAITNVVGTIGGLTGAGLAVGTGLLGALGLVAFLSYEIYQHWDEIKQAVNDTAAGIAGAAKRLYGVVTGQEPGTVEPAPTGPPGPQGPQVGQMNPFTGLPIQPIPGPAITPPIAAPFTGGAPPIAAPFTAPAAAPFAFSGTNPATGAGFSFSGGPTSGAPMPSYANIAAQRAPLMEEVDRDPTSKRLLMQMMKTEGGGTATVEALFNRVAMIRQQVPGYTIKDELNSGFYGPIKRGVAQQTDISPKEAAGFQTTLDRVGAGSNLIQGRTNQGMATDPGAGLPGRVQLPGSSEVYNFWEGQRRGVGFSVGASAAFAQQEAALAAPTAPPAPPATIAAAPQAEGKPAQVTGGPPVNGSVDVTVTHRNPPPGVTVAAKGTGDVNVAAPRTEQAQLQSI